MFWGGGQTWESDLFVQDDHREKKDQMSRAIRFFLRQLQPGRPIFAFSRPNIAVNRVDYNAHMFPDTV